eukprot:TRINITY_DN1644_c0_g1_i6.p1 TRINITY_DN1644_c0_g1~~TRINITY_DN1644_c0_g1_i6.p1  ORF type:complete len:174 (+),score=15.77 TRINITY_DN1644_c0_g1_i6:353-874(+)
MAVLIIDSVETLAKKDPEFLEVLLLFAKACADKDTMRMLFVGSEGETLPILEGYSSYSRAVPFGSLFMDIPDSQAIIYLQHLIPPEEESQAKALVKDLTGGRFTLLNKVAHLVRNGTPYEQIRGDFLNAVSEKLTACNVSKDDVLALNLLPAESEWTTFVQIELEDAHNILNL